MTTTTLNGIDPLMRLGSLDEVVTMVVGVCDRLFASRDALVAAARLCAVPGMFDPGTRFGD